MTDCHVVEIVPSSTPEKGEAEMKEVGLGLDSVAELEECGKLSCYQEGAVTPNVKVCSILVS